jgi:hypothetical protein
MLRIALRLLIIFASVVVFALMNETELLAQQPDDLQTKIGKLEAEARSECARLWSDHAFDSLRKRIPLAGEKPTFEMLKNPEKLKKVGTANGRSGYLDRGKVSESVGASLRSVTSRR